VAGLRHKRRRAVAGTAAIVVAGLLSFWAYQIWRAPNYNFAYVSFEIQAERGDSFRALVEFFQSEPDAYLTCSKADDDDPALSWDGNELAFASDRDGDWEIFLLLGGECHPYRYGTPVPDPEDTDVRQLTNNPATDRYPAWSPNGKQIAFSSDRTGVPQTYVMAADGSGLRQVTHRPTGATVPSWSPDGSSIVYQSPVGELGHNDLFLIRVDGSGDRRLTDNAADDEHPAWSGDGKTVAFVSDRDGNEEIYALDLTTNEETRLTENPGRDIEPAWKGNGVYFSTNRDGYWALYRADRNGGGDDLFRGSGRSFTAPP
jgi:Tol biopolymer transport system component